MLFVHIDIIKDNKDITGDWFLLYILSFRVLLSLFMIKMRINRWNIINTYYSINFVHNKTNSWWNLVLKLFKNVNS